MGKYITIQLPEKFVLSLIDSLVNDENLGYTSRSEVVKDAIRAHFAKYSNFPGNSLILQKSEPFLFPQEKIRDVYVLLLEIQGQNEMINKISYPSKPPVELFELIQKIGIEQIENEFFFEQFLDYYSVNYKFQIFEDLKGKKMKLKKYILSVFFPERFSDTITPKVYPIFRDFIQTLKANTWTYHALNEDLTDPTQNKNIIMLHYWIQGLYREFV